MSGSLIQILLKRSGALNARTVRGIENDLRQALGFESRALAVVVVGGTQNPRLSIKV
jgi:hypothetical protein